MPRIRRTDRVEGPERAGTGIVDYWFWCPGCDAPHRFATGAPRGDEPRWDVSGEGDARTFAPSLRSFDDAGTICHLHLKAGRIDFLPDCRHALAGRQGIEIPEFPWE